MAQKAPQIIGDGLSRGVTVLGVKLQALQQDRLQILRKAWPQGSGADQAILYLALVHLGDRGGGEGWLPSQRCVEGGSESVHICRHADLAEISGDLLWRHELGSTEGGLGQGQGFALEILGKTEVADPGCPLARGGNFQEHIRGLQVPVNELQVVGGLDTFRDLGHDLDQFRSSELIRKGLQRSAKDQLHGDLGRLAGGVHIEDFADVGMVDPTLDLGFLNEADELGGILDRQELQGDAAVQEGIEGFMDLAHAPLTEQGAHQVAS